MQQGNVSLSLRIFSSDCKPKQRNLLNLFFLNTKCAVLCTKSLHLCLILCDPMDCSPPGSSIQGILQARILEWVAVPFSRDFPDPGIKPASLKSPALAGRFFTTSTTGKPTSGVGSTNSKRLYSRFNNRGRGLLETISPLLFLLLWWNYHLANTNYTLL